MEEGRKGTREKRSKGSKWEAKGCPGRGRPRKEGRVRKRRERERDEGEARVPGRANTVPDPFHIRHTQSKKIEC